MLPTPHTSYSLFRSSLLQTLFAKAPAKHIVELARAELRANPDNVSAPLRDFAGVRLADAEVGVSHVLRRYDMMVPLPLEKVLIGDEPETLEIPWLKLSAWVKFLLETGRFSRQLCGTKDFASRRLVLGEFWRRFQCICPQHEIFEWANDGLLRLDSTVPYYSHSDEGRTNKKEAIWIFSCHGALGRGTSVVTVPLEGALRAM